MRKYLELLPHACDCIKTVTTSVSKDKKHVNKSP